ncbi:VTT domain-containing protein [Kribbella sp. NBC_01245]|uniref:DedA family protein n=1 Tax=Kribbella sp. NBC_01245 TaxID=2903578 RepID=UPI002E28B1B6|nr:VTT domain-containing protein [Kribbella sp. NBC_01245]
MTGSFDLLYLFALAGAVFLGAVLPVVPTGAAVSAAAVLAMHSEPIGLVGVLIAGAGGAYLGDLVMYAACRAGGERLARRVGWLRNSTSLAALRERLAEHEVSVLLTSRLVPGGRVPVLLSAGLAGYPWQRFAIVDLSASILWSAVYMAIGLLGSALFKDPWEGIIAAILLVLLTTLASTYLQSRRRPTTTPTPAEAPAEAN